jgi:hypothetical protein
MESRSFNERELLEQATDFERVVKASARYCDNGSRLSRLLSTLFAMKSAFLVRASLGPRDDLGEAATSGRAAVWESIEQRGLPELSEVHRAVQQLAAAVASNNRVEVIQTLEAMGIFDLCPVPGEQLSSMEHLAGNVSGRARLVFLVELLLFAAEVADFNAMKKYVSEAWGLTPSGWELYNLCIFEGLFALEAGNLDEAVQFLEKSLRACQTDEHTLIGCGLRPPNFRLAQKLLDGGLRSTVLRHLVACKTVWQRSWIPIDEWINLIEDGQVPNFDSAEGLRGMSLPSCRLDLQWMRARSLDAAKVAGPPAIARPLEEVVAAKQELLADVDRHISAKVKNAIGYLDQGLDNPPEQAPSNPVDPGDAE